MTEFDFICESGICPFATPTGNGFLQSQIGAVVGGFVDGVEVVEASVVEDFGVVEDSVVDCDGVDEAFVVDCDGVVEDSVVD